MATATKRRARDPHGRASELLQQASAASPARARALLAEAEAQLRGLRPSSARDGLLALALLGQAELGGPEAAARLRLGVAYARSSRDPEARALAQRLWNAQRLTTGASGNDPSATR